MNTFSAQEANWHAKQRTVVTGFLETAIYPKILHSASFGSYETKLLLETYDFCTPETISQVLSVLQKQGYSVKVKSKILYIDWK